MHRMTEGQVVWVRSGARATVVRAPGVAGVRALVEFADGSREWIITPEIFETELNANIAHLQKCIGEQQLKVRAATDALAVEQRKLLEYQRDLTMAEQELHGEFPTAEAPKP